MVLTLLPQEGSGYHYIQPQHSFVFEKVAKFRKFDQPSRKFMQFQDNQDKTIKIICDTKGNPKGCKYWSYYTLRFEKVL
jgi:urease beta subunit